MKYGNNPVCSPNMYVFFQTYYLAFLAANMCRYEISPLYSSARNNCLTFPAFFSKKKETIRK